MKFSVCIPNYNYARYLGETIKSVLSQEDVELEVNIVDNCSNDGSEDVVKSFLDDRIRFRVNQCNVGFSRNLDKVGAMAEGQVMIMLSSDDMIMHGALATYRRILEKVGTDPEKTILTSSVQMIDEKGSFIREIGFPHRALWSEADRTTVPGIGEDLPVYRAEGGELLRRSMLLTDSPFNFLATAYPRTLFAKVEGYGGGRLFAPDKWFHWRLLAEPGTTAFFVKKPLFQYRWHGSNQVAQQKRSGALKLIVDEYLDTVETTDEMLQRAGLSRQDLVAAFLEWDVVRRGVYELGIAGRQEALRIYRFGKAAYPAEAIRNAHMWGFGAILCLGPAAAPVARLIRKLYK